MGKGFGNLAYVRRQIWFSLSPYEQRPFAKFFKAGFPNTLRRIAEEAPYVAPPLLMGYFVYKWTVDEAHRLSRKSAQGEHGGGSH